MGFMYQLYCKKCDYEMPLRLGDGMDYPIEVTSKNQYEYDDDFKKFFDEHEDGKVVLSENFLARCVECGEYEVIGDWTMHFCEEKIPFPRKCKHCGGELEIILSEEDCNSSMQPPFGITMLFMVKIIMNSLGIISLADSKKLKGKMICPKCHKKLFVKWTGMWD